MRPRGLIRGGVFALLLGSGAGCGDALPPTLRIGSEVAAEQLQSPREGRSLLWVLQPSDYLQCQSHAREIRRVQRQGGAALPLTVVAVGGRGDWARSFIQRERLGGRVVEMTPAAYRRAFGARPRSALYVLSGSRVRASVSVVERTEMEEGALSALLDGVSRQDAAGSTGAREP